MDDNLPLRLTRYLKSIVRTSPLQSAEAFGELYARTHLLVFRYIYGLRSSSIQDAEDLTAETFIRAWKARERFFGDQGAAVGWLLQIARRLVIDHYRRQTVRGYSADLERTARIGTEDSLEEQVFINEQKRILWQLLQALSFEQREMLVLRYLLGWKVNQIASYKGLKENTVSVAIRRTLTHLSQSWPSASHPEDRWGEGEQ